MGRTQQTARSSQNTSRQATAPPPPGPQPPPAPEPPPIPGSDVNELTESIPRLIPPSKVKKGKKSKKKDDVDRDEVAWSSSRRPRTMQYSPPYLSPEASEDEDFLEGQLEKQDYKSALNFVTSDDLIVGKSRLRPLDRDVLKPSKLTADNFLTHFRSKGIALFAAKSFLLQTALSKNLTQLSLAGMDQLTDLFFKLVLDSNTEMVPLTHFNCSGCVLITDYGIRWMSAVAPNLNEVKCTGCKLVTSISLSHLLKKQPTLTNLDFAATSVDTVPVEWGSSGAGLKVDGCPLICPPFHKFITTFKTSRHTYGDSKIHGSGQGVFFDEDHFKIVIVRAHDLDFSIAKFLHSDGQDSKPDTQPLTHFSDVKFGTKLLNIYEINRLQATQDMIISNGSICVLPFGLHQCEDEGKVKMMATYVAGKISFFLAKRLPIIPVIVGVNKTGVPDEQAKEILQKVTDAAAAKINLSASTVSKQYYVMSRRNWRIDDLDVHAQLYTGEAAKMADYLSNVYLYAAVLNADQKADPATFLSVPFQKYREEFSWMNITSVEARGLTQSYFHGRRIMPLSKITEEATEESRRKRFHVGNMVKPCLERLAQKLHQTGEIILGAGMKDRPIISDMNWFSKVLTVVMTPPTQDETMRKQICFMNKEQPVWTEKTLRGALGDLATPEEFSLLVKLLKDSGFLIEVKVDRLSSEMPETIYIVADTLADDVEQITNLEDIWPPEVDPSRSVIQIDKHYRFASGMTMSLMPEFFGRCAKFFKFTILCKYGCLIRRGGVELLVDVLSGINADPVVVFSCRTENRPLRASRCREHCLWNMMNTVTMIMDYCIKKRGMFANVAVPCPTCVPSRDRKKIARDKHVYRYFLHMITVGKDRGLRCHSERYNCHGKDDSRTLEELLGPQMDLIPKHLTYMLDEIASSIPKLSRCSLCQNCVVNGKNCPHNGLHEGSVSECGCGQTPRTPVCPGCGICWKCTNYIKKMYYSLHPQSVCNLEFKEFNDDEKPGRELDVKNNKNSWFQVSNLNLYVLKSTKFTPEKFNRFDVTSYKGNKFSLGLMGTKPGEIYGPLVTYSMSLGSIGNDWKFEENAKKDPNWVCKDCIQVSVRVRNPEEDDEEAKKLDFKAVIVEFYKMDVKIWSGYLPRLQMEVALYGEGSCNMILETPTISLEGDFDRYHPASFSGKMYVELEIEEDKSKLLLSPIKSVQQSGFVLETDNLELTVKHDNPLIHPLGYSFGGEEERTLSLLERNREKREDGIFRQSKGKQVGKGRRSFNLGPKEVPSIEHLNHLVDEDVIRPVPLWFFSKEQRENWTPSIIDVFGCRKWFESPQALVTAYTRSKVTQEFKVKKYVDDCISEEKAYRVTPSLLFPMNTSETMLRFQNKPKLQSNQYQALPLCSRSPDKLNVHLMNIPGVSMEVAMKEGDVDKEASPDIGSHVLPLQAYMALNYKALLPGYDAFLGGLPDLDTRQVHYLFRKLLLDVACSLMMQHVDNFTTVIPRIPLTDNIYRNPSERFLDQVTLMSKSPDEETLVCPAHKRFLTFDPPDLEFVPNLTSYLQFLKTLGINQNTRSLPESLFDLTTQLETLSIENSHLSELPQSLKLCRRIANLQLAGSQISSLPPEIFGSHLVSLDISRTRIRTIPDSISDLKSLEFLHADYLFIKELPEAIGKLTNLKYLSLKGCCLTFLPDSLSELKNLTSLSLSGVPWLEIKPGHFVTAESLSKFLSAHNMTDEVKDIEQLKNANLNQTMTIDPKEVGNLNALLYQNFPRFGFHGNQKPAEDSIGGFPPEILALENLQHLDLSYQGIVSVPPEVGDLTQLGSLVVGPNPYLTTLPGAVGCLPLERLNIDDCPSLRTPPPEIVSKGFAAVLAYLRRLVTGSVSCKRTKLMMVGLGGAGKTSLVKSLLSGTNTAHFASGEAITDGIDIATWAVPSGNDTVTYSVWDFAGQTVYYNTHQFFLSNRAVYLLLWNIRLGYEHAGLDFWLSSIAVHSPQAPIIIVGTHLDQVSKFEIPIDELISRYPQIVGFHFISTLDGKGVSELKDKLLEVTLQQKYMGEMIPEVWLNFETNILRARSGSSVIDYEEVEKLAIDSGIFDSIETKQAVHFLHDLGALQHFDNEFLKDRVVINPQWIVDVMACVVSVNDSFIMKGKLKHSDIGNIWRDFPSELHEWLLRLTEEFDLTFPLPDKAMNLVPCLLPEKEPEISWPEVETSTGMRETKMEYEFAYLPVGLFNRGQVRLYEYSDSSLIWKRGSLLKKNGHMALVTQTRDNKLLVKCQGPRPENILFLIHEVFETLIQESFQGVIYDFKVPCPECLKGAHDPFMFNGSIIRRAAGLKAPFLQCVRNFHIISIADLNGICPPDDSQDYDLHLQNTVRSLTDLRMELSADIFISYSHSDVPKSGQSMIHPKQIRDGLEAAGYKCWFEDKTDKDFLEERVLALRDAKIFLVLMSSNYINDQECCNMFKFARTVLKKPLLLAVVGPGGHEWKQSALGMLVADEVYVNFKHAEHFDAKVEDLLKALNDRTTSLQESGEKPQCFISYCWNNSQRAVDMGQKLVPGAIGNSDPRDLKDYLEQKGIKTWIDIERAGKGGLFEDIAEGLRDAKVMIACVSDEYADSLNCQMEFRFAAKALNLPIIIAVYGTGHRWRSSEIGMLSLQYLQVSFQDRNDASPEKVYQFVKSHIHVRDPRDVARRKRAKDAENEKHQKTSYQELYELAQRKFLRQVSSYADTYELQPYPRLVVVDFAETDSVTPPKDDSSEDTMTERPKLIRRSSSMTPQSSLLQRNMCFRILCECEQGWHLQGDPIPVPPLWNQKVMKYAPYLARIMAVIRYSSKIQLNCLDGEDGEKFIKFLEEHCTSDSGLDFKEAYQELRNTALEADTGKTLGGLSRCHLASGKIFWLCKNHQNGPRMTVLSNTDVTVTHTTTDTVLESFMLENLAPLDAWEREAEVIKAELEVKGPSKKPKKKKPSVENPKQKESDKKESKQEETPAELTIFLTETQPSSQEIPSAEEETSDRDKNDEQLNLEKPKTDEQEHSTEKLNLDQKDEGSENDEPRNLLDGREIENESIRGSIELPSSRPTSAQSISSNSNVPIPARRTSITSNTSRRSSAASIASQRPTPSRRTSNASVASLRHQETPLHRLQHNDDAMRFLASGIAAATAGARQYDASPPRSRACSIL